MDGTTKNNLQDGYLNHNQQNYNHELGSHNREWKLNNMYGNNMHQGEMKYNQGANNNNNEFEAIVRKTLLNTMPLVVKNVLDEVSKNNDNQ